MTEPEFLKARRKRNIALALALVAFVLIVFVVTVAKYHVNTTV